MKQILIALVVASVAPIAMAQSPNAVIEEAMDLLVTKIDGRSEELAANRTELYSIIDEILLPRFDRRYAAQRVLGPSWRTANEDQRNQFIAAFYASLLRKYSDGVLEFDREKTKILPFRGDETRPRVKVKTMVTLEDGTKVPVDYGLVKRDSGWLMFDVVIEGISYLVNFRAEFGAEIQNSSLDAVIARLEREAEDQS